MELHDMVQAHYDLIVEIRHQLELSKSKVKAIVVPGQSSATLVPSDSAVIIQGSDILSLLTIAQPIGIDRLIQGKRHHETLKVKIMKDNCWTDDQFNQVAWREFHSAFKGVSCSHRISIAKMTNNCGIQTLKIRSSMVHQISALFVTASQKRLTISFVARL
jgi:hypothetical protein